MSARKRISAEQRKENRKEVALAVLKNAPSSPRKMRYVADMVRGMEVFKALGVLKFSSKGHREELKNYYSRPSLTGNRKTNAKPKQANFISK